MPKAVSIVLTGGPCAGKTTALSMLSQWLAKRSVTAVVVPETATLLMQGGLNPRDPSVSPFDFQHRITTFQTMMETHFRDIAESYANDRKVVLLFDRGLMDSKAYVEPEVFEELLRATGWREALILERYDAVLHLRTAALGAEAFYTLANNATRRESFEEAVAADERTLAAWLGHTHLRIIPNESGKTFEDKMTRVKKHIAHMLGIPEPLEIERKFIVDRHRLGDIPVPYRRLSITQTYLDASKGIEARVRATEIEGVATYTHTTKRFVRPGVRVEEECRISAQEYMQFLRTKDPERGPILKDRMVFEWSNQYFELDVFTDRKDRLTLLEVELTDLQDRLILPPFIPVITEVTDDPAYSNARLGPRL